MQQEQYDQLKPLCEAARAASVRAALIPSGARNAALERIADRLLSDSEAILEANRLDVEAAGEAGLEHRFVERLRLDENKIGGLCDALLELARLPDPVGTGEVWSRPSGIEIRRVRVPLGVVAFVYECRPELSVRAAGLCIKTGNAAVIYGGASSVGTDGAVMASVRAALEGSGTDASLVTYIDPMYSEAPEILAGMQGAVDLLIPYGSRDFIRRAAKCARVPVIQTGPGNCHMYIDFPCDIARAVKVAVNAKCLRPAEGNAIETLLVHKDAAAEFLPAFRRAAQPYHIEFRGCPRTREYLPDAVPAVRDDWSTEYGDNILALKVVDSAEEAITHINTYGTGHSEAIITGSLENARLFQRAVDSSAVYVNASTRFSEGWDFGNGISVGTSTQKYHTRGPLSLASFTADKYLITGDGNIK